MSGVVRVLARVRLFGLAVATLALGLVACGGEDGGASGTTAPTGVESEGSSDVAVADEPIVIRTSMTLTAGEEIVASGEVLDGSTVGDSPFCPGGTIEDRHGETPDVALVDRTITCSDGTLELGFSPQRPVGNTQSGAWSIVGGTGSYEGWQGRGEMKMVYDTRGANPTSGDETFTGTITSM